MGGEGNFTNEFGHDMVPTQHLEPRHPRCPHLTVGRTGLIGVSLGAVAGNFGGVWDILTMRAVDILLAFPLLILAMAIMSIFPQTTQ